MENQLPQMENISVSTISAMANVKEVDASSRNYTHAAILFLMIIFSVFVVGLSVYNFQSNVTPELKVIHAEENHSQDLQKLTNQ